MCVASGSLLYCLYPVLTLVQCPTNRLDLSPSLFEAMAPLSAGVMALEWCEGATCLAGGNGTDTTTTPPPSSPAASLPFACQIMLGLAALLPLLFITLA